jgi:hypothetical protein
MSEKPAEREHDEGAWRQFRHYAYLDRPYAEVLRLVSTSPGLFVGDHGVTSGGAQRLAEFHLQRAGLDIARDVRITLGTLQRCDHGARLPIEWQDFRWPRLFPVVKAVIELLPLTGVHQATQVGLVGCYRPPLGRLGAVADTLAGTRVVLESAGRFLEEIAARLEARIKPIRFVPSSLSAGVGETGRRRRVFVPTDGLDYRPGGAAGVEARLRAEPGVLGAEVDAVAELAVIEYDPTTCSLGCLLTIVDPNGVPPEMEIGNGTA